MAEVAGMVMVFLLGTLGGLSGGDGGQAPRDTAAEAAAAVLPDAALAVHVDVGGALAMVDTMVGELEGLGFAKQSVTFGRALKDVRTMMDDVYKTVGQEMGVNPRTQVGSVTLSVATVGKDDVRVLLRVRGELAGMSTANLLGDKPAAAKTFKGAKLHPLPDGGPVKDHVLAQPDSNTLVIGPRELVQDVVAKKAWKGTERSASTRIAAMVDGDTRSFVYVAPAPWMEAELKSPSDRILRDIVGGTDYAVYAVGKTARGRLVAKNAAFAVRMSHVAQSVASLIGAIEPLVDAAAHGAAGVLPWAAGRKAADTAEVAADDATTLMEAGAWAKKRFGGKAEAKLDGSSMTVELSLSNPASLTGLLLPGVGAGMWWGFRGGSSYPEPAYEEFPHDGAPLDH